MFLMYLLCIRCFAVRELPALISVGEGGIANLHCGVAYSAHIRLTALNPTDILRALPPRFCFLVVCHLIVQTGEVQIGQLKKLLR